MFFSTAAAAAAAAAAATNLRVAGHEIPTPLVFQELGKVVTFERERIRSRGMAAGFGPADQRGCRPGRGGGGGGGGGGRVQSVVPWF